MKQLACDQLTLMRGSKIICDQLCLSIQAGEVWAILGPNGTGKTTLLHALAGCYPKVHGEIYLHDKPLKHYSRKAIARAIGVLLQDFTPALGQTVGEYCATGRFPYLSYFQNSYFQKTSPHDQQLIQHALEIMDLLPFTHTITSQLSGGEKRRLSIASVIAQTPDIFLLDEPTNHLDLRYQVRTLAYFRDLAINHAKTIAFSCHDINLAQQFGTHALLLYPHGTTLSGAAGEVLTAENLSLLYQQEVQRIDGHTPFFRFVLS